MPVRANGDRARLHQDTGRESWLSLPHSFDSDTTDITRFMKILPAVFVQALACLTMHAGEEPPAWSVKAFNEKLGTRYELVQKLQPSFYVGDFNGDGTSDVALLIKERTTAKVGIAIVKGGEGKIKIVGAGKSFGNGGDDFSWMDAWSIRHTGNLDRLHFAKSEAASAEIYWDGSRYKWQQEGD
jgi:hypothetical protein